MLESNSTAFRRHLPQGNDDDGGSIQLAPQILDSIEQGVVIWSAAGTCQLINSLLFDVLEIEKGAFQPGQSFVDFLDCSVARGVVFSPEPQALAQLFGKGGAFQFDCTTQSGGAVRGNARTLRGGGYVICFSDVSRIRDAVESLAAAQENAAIAEHKAAEILDIERSRQRESDRLATLDEWLQSCKSLDELFKVVSAFMHRTMPATSGQLFIYSNSRDMLVAASAWNGAQQANQVTPDECWALRRGRKYLYDPGELCFVCDHVSASVGPDGDVGQYLCIPVVAHGETVGLFHIAFHDAMTELDLEDPVKFCSRCAERISMAIANVKLRDELHEQSTRDPLTGLYNRRYFLDAIRRELMAARHAETSLALLAVDADHFKTFNDTNGHDAGDDVLQAIAQRMRGLVAEQGIACRLGGEEFSILLPKADRTIATGIAEDLRHAVSELRVEYLGGHLPNVTVSIGIAIFPTHGTQVKDLMKQADIALYAAKNAGRNRLQIAEGERLTFFE